MDVAALTVSTKAKFERLQLHGYIRHEEHPRGRVSK